MTVTKHLKLREKKLNDLNEVAVAATKKAKAEKELLIKLESGKLSVLNHLTDKIKRLSEKTKALLKKISWLEHESLDLKEVVSRLTKQNSNLVRENENLAYQNEVQSVGLKRQRSEICSIINLIERGKHEEISQHYNKNKEYVL